MKFNIYLKFKINKLFGLIIAILFSLTSISTVYSDTSSSLNVYGAYITSATGTMVYTPTYSYSQNLQYPRQNSSEPTGILINSSIKIDFYKSYSSYSNITLSDTVDSLISLGKISILGIPKEEITSYFYIHTQNSSLCFDLRPNKMLNPNTWYRFYISRDAVKESDTNAISNNDMWFSFLTNSTNNSISPVITYPSISKVNQLQYSMSSFYSYNYGNSTYQYNYVYSPICVKFNSTMNINQTNFSSIYLTQYDYNSQTCKNSNQINIPIDVKWSDNQTLMITPKTQVMYSNKYRLYIPNNLLSDLNGNYFQTADKDSNGNLLNGQNIYFYSSSKPTTYNESDVPSVYTDFGNIINMYNSSNTTSGAVDAWKTTLTSNISVKSNIEIGINGETTVIDDFEDMDPSKVSQTTTSSGIDVSGSLREIKLEQITNDSDPTATTPVAFDIDTYYDNVSNYSKITLKPKNTLINDTYYKVTIPSARIRRKASSAFNSEDYSATNGAIQGGVYYFKTVKDLVGDVLLDQNQTNVFTVAYPQSQQVKITGNNISKNAQVSIVDKNNNIVIDKKYITPQVLDSKTLVFNMPTMNRITSSGLYGVKFETVRDNSVYSTVYCPNAINVIDKPKIGDINLLRGNPKRIDEKSIPDTIMLFDVQKNDYVPFKALIINLAGQYIDVPYIDLLGSITVAKKGVSGSNYVNTEKINDLLNEKNPEIKKMELSRIYNQDTHTITLPIKDLDENSEYQVEIPQNIFRNKISVTDAVYNESYPNTNFPTSFKTMFSPKIKSIDTGSILQGYPSGTKIKVYCDNIISGVTTISLNNVSLSVDWNNSKVDDLNSGFITAIIPDNMQPGIYNINVYNDVHHYDTLNQGFSVVGIKRDDSNSGNKNDIGSIVNDKKSQTITLKVSDEYANSNKPYNLNLENLGLGKKWIIDTTYSSASKSFAGSIISSQDFTLKINKIDMSKYYSSRQTIEFSKVSWSSVKIKNKQLCSKVISIKLNNYANMDGHIDLKYIGDYDKSMAIYAMDSINNRWQKVSGKVNVNRLDRTINMDFKGNSVSGELKFAIFK